MKILLLCKKFPYPLKDGESIAVHNLSKALHELGCKVTLLAMNTRKHFFDTRRLPASAQHFERIYTAPVDNRVKPLGAFLNLFSKESYHISRFISPEFKRQLTGLLRTQSFDLVQLETLYLAPYIPVIRAGSDAAIAMRAHNVEYEIWERIAANTSWFPKKRYLEHLSAKLRRYELSQFDQYDLLAPITERDLRTFRSQGCRTAAVVTPIGIDSRTYRPDYDSYQQPLTLSFIGSLDWMPNLEGLMWFLREVWPQVNRRHPDLELHVAGRNTPDWLFRTAGQKVIVHGEVASAADFVNAHSLMVAPLLSGSGMRAKILEGMALGKVVLTTSMGIEGITAKHQQEVLIADCPRELAQAIDFCVENREQLEGMGRRAREFVSRHYDSRTIARRLVDAYAALTVEV